MFGFISSGLSRLLFNTQDPAMPVEPDLSSFSPQEMELLQKIVKITKDQFYGSLASTETVGIPEVKAMIKLQFHQSKAWTEVKNLAHEALSEPGINPTAARYAKTWEFYVGMLTKTHKFMNMPYYTSMIPGGRLKNEQILPFAIFLLIMIQECMQKGAGITSYPSLFQMAEEITARSSNLATLQKAQALHKQPPRKLAEYLDVERVKLILRTISLVLVKECVKLRKFEGPFLETEVKSQPTALSHSQIETLKFKLKLEVLKSEKNRQLTMYLNKYWPSLTVSLLSSTLNEDRIIVKRGATGSISQVEASQKHLAAAKGFVAIKISDDDGKDVTCQLYHASKEVEGRLRKIIDTAVQILNNDLSVRWTPKSDRRLTV